MRASREKWALPAILLVGLALRLIGINSRPLFYDEAFSYFLSIQPFEKIVQGTAVDTMPPLYYFLLHIWALAGHSVWWLRSLNVLISLGVIYLVFRLVRDLYGFQAGLWAGLFTAVAPFQIYYAQEMRMYTLLALGLVGYAYCFLHIYREDLPFRKNWRLWTGLVLFGAIALYSHNLAGFTLVVPPLYLILKRRLRLFGKLIVSLLVMGVAFLPWLFLVPGQVQKIQTAFWTPRPGVVEILQLLIMFVTNLPLPPWGTIVAAVITLQLIVLAILELRRNRWKDDGIQFLICFMAAPAIILFGISYLMRPVFIPRGLIASGMMGYVILARLAACGQNRVIGRAMGGVFLFAAVAALPFQILYREFPRSPYQEAVTWLQARPQNGEVVLHENKLSFFSMEFYAPNLNQVFLPDPPGSGNDTLAPVSAQVMRLVPAADPASAVGNGEHVNYVIFQRQFDELQDAKRTKTETQIWLESRFHLTGTQKFGDLWVMQYDR